MPRDGGDEEEPAADCCGGGGGGDQRDGESPGAERLCVKKEDIHTGAQSLVDGRVEGRPSVDCVVGNTEVPVPLPRAGS